MIALTFLPLRPQALLSVSSAQFIFQLLVPHDGIYLAILFQVFIINLLRDSKYHHFRPVMDTYIQKHFAGALAYK